MSININISVGEFLDKLSILEIKRIKITDQAKLENINREFEALMEQWNKSEYAGADISGELAELGKINEKLWDIEDKIRSKEAKGEFDEAFIELARSVYIFNDERADIKRKLNKMLNSDLMEEKSYKQS
jgi:predicted  nucleic acid-binding Zn-ribbon protein